MAEIIKTTFQLRRGNLEVWERNNPILAKGEPSFVVDKNALKIGDGVTPWKELEYIGINQDDLAKAIEDYFEQNPGAGGTGADGRGIVSIIRTDGDGSAGTIDTYTITYTDLTTSTFTVYNGKDGVPGNGIAFIEYEITTTPGVPIPLRFVLDNGDTYDVTIPGGPEGPSGRGIKSIFRTSGNGAPGTTDVYTIYYSDHTTSTFDVYNGKDGESGSQVVADSNIFLVEIIENDASNPPYFYADKSFNEILKAAQEDKVVICRVKFANMLLPAFVINTEAAIFSTVAILPSSFIDGQGGEDEVPLYVNATIKENEVSFKVNKYDGEIQKSIKAALNEAKENGEFDGRGITSISKTGGNSAPGTSDTYTIYYSDDTTSTFNVYNGKDGNVADYEQRPPQIFQVSSFELLPTTNVYIGDFGIVKVQFGNNNYSHTAYVYTENGWAAMDGNYNANNVYFDEDLLVTTKIGTIQTLTNGQATLSAKGKTLKQVFSSLIAERKNPSATLPSGTVELTNYENGNYLVEVGETIVPSWKTTFGAGSYTYGPATGVTSTQAKVYLSTNSNSSSTISAGEMNGKTGTLNALTIQDSTTKHYAKVDYGWTQGTSVPKDNFGDDYTNTSKNLPIQAASNKTDTSTYYIQGYRKAFFGSRVSPIELNSHNIRSLMDNTNSSNPSFTIAIDQGATQVVIAVPPGRVVKKVEDNGAFGQDILEAFDKHLGSSGIKVGGADATESNIGSCALYYNVYVYNPSTPLGTNTYTVILDDE